MFSHSISSSVSGISKGQGNQVQLNEQITFNSQYSYIVSCASLWTLYLGFITNRLPGRTVKVFVKVFLSVWIATIG